MVIGASWSGARAFTSTSGPGISLMSELIGLALLRRDPGGDRRRAAHRAVDGHADAHAAGRHPRLRLRLARRHQAHPALPGEPRRVLRDGAEAFDLAERFQTPVFVLSDLDIGMNDWVCPALEVGRQLRPGPRAGARRRRSCESCEEFHRYSPADADSVAARTLPGVSEKGAFFTRGSGHNKLGGYTEIPDEYQEVMDRLARKHAAPPSTCRRRSSHDDAHAPLGIVTLGGCELAVREAIEILAERGIAADYMRVRGFPFGAAVRRFSTRTSAIFVVEQNRDAQLRTLLTLETPVPKEKLRVGARLRRLPAERRGRRRRRRARSWRREPMPSIVKPAVTHPGLRAQRARPHRPRLRGRRCRRSAPAAATTRSPRRSCRRSASCDAAAHDRQALRHRLLVEDADLLRARRARLQRRHGRMPAIATGASAANRDLLYIGISGDGDSLSIGLGQLAHPIRRNVRMLYVIENNGVYGLTKGQFSASADVGSKTKRGEANHLQPIDPVLLGLSIGRDLRGAQLLRRQAPAGADPQGGHGAPRVRAHRRHLAVRDLQRPRGLDQELPLHAPARCADDGHRLRAAGRRDLRDDSRPRA